MGKRTRYEPGTFCWVDLATTDLAAAKSFYAALFGWRANDMPMGDGQVYSMQQVDDDTVAAIYELEAERRSMGIPPHWSHYVSVVDADATAARASKLGGTVLAEPFDVYDSGRMAVIQDPTGAAFGIWQPKAFTGASRVNDPGCLSWDELQTRDPDAAVAFYTGLFGWEMARVEQDGNLVYRSIENGGRRNGGIMPMTEHQAGVPPYWLAYFTVPSADATAARASELGGEALVEPFDLPGGPGRIAVIRDPQGAVFAIYEGPVDD